MTPLDATVSRPLSGGPSFSAANRATRLAWTICWLAFAAWTPRQFAPWRRALLRAFGATMAPGSDVRASARVWYPANLVMGPRAVLSPRVNCYSQARITLGADALVSQGAHLCAGTHDVDDPAFQLIARPITIGDGAWIAAEAFVGPGAIIGDRAVLGARAVAFGSLEAGMIHVGNPATPVRPRRIVAA